MSQLHESLDPRLTEAFCAVLGEEHRGRLDPTTSMDDIDGWDSLTFVELVVAWEDAFGVELTDDEAAQMFQLGHAQRILQAASAERPHDDVAYAACMLEQLRGSPPGQLNLVVLSGSSTREALLPAGQARDMLSEITGRASVGWFNLSVSGLVVAETLQLLEQVVDPVSGVIVMGMSPVILSGCGEAEFRRSANRRRFPFPAPVMARILGEHEYEPDADAAPTVQLDVWVKRYLRGRSLDELQYDPYQYPTLAPWTPERYDDEDAILRFYNNSLLNHRQSARTNAPLMEAIVERVREVNAPLALLDLPLHSRMRDFLDELGGVDSFARTWATEFGRTHGLPILDVPRAIGLTDDDFRDPAHITKRREDFTRRLIIDALACL